MPFFGEGPKTLWEHELESLSKAGLIILVNNLYFRLSLYGYRVDQDITLRNVRDCKKYGRWENESRAIQKWRADPDKAYVTEQRRKKSAKAAANRRKREASRAKKEARA